MGFDTIEINLVCSQWLQTSVKICSVFLLKNSVPIRNHDSYGSVRPRYTALYETMHDCKGQNKYKRVKWIP